MPHWTPEPFWSGRDVYVVGGGPSLRDFDWSLLKGRCVIGCNTAFRLGEDVVDICVFGDFKWFRTYKKDLAKFTGMVVTNAPRLRREDVSWVLTMKRCSKGLGTDALGWNGNTGASALNLALILGAKRAFLLGFDMRLSGQGEANWHDYRCEPADGKVYDRFMRGFQEVRRDWKAKFADRLIVNVTNDSDLRAFPKIRVDTHFKGKGESHAIARRDVPVGRAQLLPAR